MVKEALALQEAGCFGIVLECVPALVGAAVTRALDIPTIGIGAGPSTSGQASAMARQEQLLVSAPFIILFTPVCQPWCGRLRGC